MSCLICAKISEGNLCKEHELMYIWDINLKGLRLKKRNNGYNSRYTMEDYHKTETKLVKLIERIYGKKNVITSWHPIWAKSSKQVLYEYDIYIPKHNLLIEYNGQQHYRYVPFFHKTKKAFTVQKKRDKIKKSLAIKNKHNLIVFKYDEPIILDYVNDKLRR